MICGRIAPKKVVHPGEGLAYSPFDVTHAPGCPTCEQAIRDAYGPVNAPTMLRAINKLAEALERRLR